MPSGYPNSIAALFIRYPAVFDVSDAHDLRRIAMTLHNWHEAECNGEIQRDEETGKAVGVYCSIPSRPTFPTPDREAGALKRLAKVMERYPDFLAYVQSDPRGAPLYIVAKADIPEGGTLDQFYTRGVALYK